MTITRPAPVPLHRSTLSNGLRIVLAPHWPTPRTAVSVHYGVGFRAERPGQEGMAHLFEHLMFRGSESLPDGAFYDALHPLAGTANGTTHQDYTDYFQTVPAQALEQALFREADRMRAPRFTRRQLDHQLAEVVREIGQMRDGRPYGALPWPLLPRVMFRTFASTHDGYGDATALQRVTVTDCARFFEAYYTPSNAVLTVLGPHRPEDVLPLVERHFGDIPPRTTASLPSLAEPLPTEERRLHLTIPQAQRTAVAVGYRLPDPATRTDAYVAHMILAEIVQQSSAEETGVPASAGCGFFGPLDARGPDALVIAALLSPGSSSDDFLARLTSWWQRSGDQQKEASSAARSLAARLRREHAGLQERCRALGRTELLYGRPELVHELPGLVERTPWSAVADAAAHLATAPAGVLTLGPEPADGSAATATPQPVPAAEQAAPSTPTRPQRAPGQLGRTAAGPRPMPPLGKAVAPRFAGALETVLGNGVRVLSVPDRRTPMVELRLRVAPGTAGWRRPAAVTWLLRRADGATGASARVRRLGGELRISSTGQWADIDGWVPREAYRELLTVVSDLLTAPELPDVLPPQASTAPKASPEQRMDQALGLHWLGGAGEEIGPPAALYRRMLSPGAAVLVVVGDIAPEDAVSRADGAFSHWTGDPPQLSPAFPAAGPIRLVVPEPAAGPAVGLTLCALEPENADDLPARYLATALLGGHYGARLAERCRRLNRSDRVMFAARDIVAGRARALVRVTTRRAEMAQAVEDVRAETAALATAPPSPEELDTVRRYCGAQLLTAFDSPGLLADALRHTMVSGRGLDWVITRPQLLGPVTGEEVTAAAGALFGPVADTVVAWGDLEPHALEAELSPC